MDLATRLDTGKTLAVLAVAEGARRRSSTTTTVMTMGGAKGTMCQAMSGRWGSRRIAILARSTPRVIVMHFMVREMTQARTMIRDPIRIRVWTTRRSPIVEVTLMMVRAVET